MLCSRLNRMDVLNRSAILYGMAGGMAIRRKAAKKENDLPLNPRKNTKGLKAFGPRTLTDAHGQRKSFLGFSSVWVRECPWQKKSVVLVFNFVFFSGFSGKSLFFFFFPCPSADSVAKKVL